MSVFNKITPMTVTLLALLLPSLSFGAGNSGAQIVNRVYVDQYGVMQIWGELGVWSNHDGCDSSERIIFQPEHDGTVNENYSEGYALIVASYLQGKEISGWLSGCVYPEGNYFSYPEVWGVNSYK